MEGGKYCCRETRPAITRSQTRVRAQETIWKGKSLEGGRKKLVGLNVGKGSAGRREEVTRACRVEGCFAPTENRRRCPALLLRLLS